MSELQGRISRVDFIPRVDLKSGFHFSRMALGYEKFTAVRTEFGL